MSKISATLPTIDCTIKSGLMDIGASGTYIRPDDPPKSAHKRGPTIIFHQHAAANYHKT